ncbi:hypothetical protein AYI69_g9467, partial [Smittium culicis]
MFGAKKWPPEILLLPTQFWWPESLPTNLCEIEEGGRLLNCALSMDVFSLIYGPVVFHRTAVQRPQSR